MNNQLANQMLNLISNGGNPQQLILSYLQQTSQQNPLLSNLLGLAANNDKAGIQQFAQNIVSAQGKDFNTEFTKFKQSLNL